VTLPRPEPSQVNLLIGAGAESDLDAIFSRLTTQTTTTPVATSPPKTVKDAPLAGPDKTLFSFEEEVATTNTITKANSNHPVSSPVSSVKANEGATAEKIKGNDKQEVVSLEERDQQYLRKAAEYLSALPNGNIVSVQNIKIVTAKLRSSYSLDGKLTAGEVDKLKARYVFAVVNYINQVVKKSAKPLTADFVKKTLQDNDGNILGLYAALVEGQYLTLENLDEVGGLCKTILDILPKAEPTVSASNTETKPIFTAAMENKPQAKDPMDSVKAWPTQEKRENRKTTSCPFRIGRMLIYRSCCVPCLHSEGGRGNHECQQSTSPCLGRQTRIYSVARSWFKLRGREVPDSRGLRQILQGYRKRHRSKRPEEHHRFRREAARTYFHQ
jgi:hypothetical protein